MKAVTRRVSASSNSQLYLLLPLLRAYGLAYLSTTGPRLLKLFLINSKKRSRTQHTWSSLYSALIGSLALRRFPTFCAALLGGYTFLQRPLRMLYDCLSDPALIGHNRCRRDGRLRFIASHFIAALFSAWFSLELLNLPERMEPAQSEESVDPQTRRSHVPAGYEASGTSKSQSSPKSIPLLSGKSIDLTIFAVVRAIETTTGTLWRRSKNSLTTKHSLLKVLVAAISHHTDTLVFALSAGTVMWAWFYLPNRLPRAYNKWIGEVAQVDSRLIDVLRLAHKGEFVYGQNNGNPALALQGMCKDYNWPQEWGDPEKTIPIPCEMVHMGTGPNCHLHAAARFSRAFRLALATNLPLQLLAKMLARRRYQPFSILGDACREAVRSSAFLGAFVALMYYGICLSRTQVGPKAFGTGTVSRQRIDSGLCVRAACILCGWSILIEAERRRQEVAMFVAPRALATLLPRQYDSKYFWREKAAFSLSTAVLFTMAQENPVNVRGLFGRLLQTVLQE